MSFFSRLIDVNYNRATEGLRVAEEVLRHYFFKETSSFFVQIRDMRHALRLLVEDFYPKRLSFRDTENDPGKDTEVFVRKTHLDLLGANLKRAQEALRVLEECATTTASKSAFSQLRFKLYTLEKNLLGKLKRQTKYAVVQKNIYVISDDPKILLKSVKQGINLIQLRDKNASAQQILHKARWLKENLAQLKLNPIFILNDRPDLAKLVEADGVHLGQDDLSIAQGREILGSTKLVGKSTHSWEQALKAQEQGADYIGVGPLWETPTKPGRLATGVELAQRVAQELTVPFFAIGGINAQNLLELINADIKRVAIVRAAVTELEKIQKMLIP